MKKIAGRLGDFLQRLPGWLHIALAVAGGVGVFVDEIAKAFAFQEGSKAAKVVGIVLLLLATVQKMLTRAQKMSPILEQVLAEEEGRAGSNGVSTHRPALRKTVEVKSDGSEDSTKP